MSINKLAISYPDFKLHEVIDPDQVDQNNADIKGKVDELTDIVNAITSGEPIESSNLSERIRNAENKMETHELNTNNPHAVTTEQVNLLTHNSRSNTSIPNEYPMGVSVMRVNQEATHNFPEQFGNVETIRTTTGTATQRFVGTGASTSVYVRQTLSGVWQSWRSIPLIASGEKTLYGRQAITANANSITILTINFPQSLNSNNPIVIPGLHTTRPDIRNVGVWDTTSTGFTVHIHNGGTSATVTLSWIAIG